MKKYAVYLNDKEKGYIICHSRNVTELIYDVKLTIDGNMYLLQEVSEDLYKKNVTGDNDKTKSIYYRVSICKRLDYDVRTDYYFKIAYETNRWKPKLAQTQCKKIMGQAVSDTEKKILDLNNDENYTGQLQVYI